MCLCADGFHKFFYTLSGTIFRVPRATILTLKTLTESRLWLKYILRDFSCIQWGVVRGENHPMTEKGIMRRDQ